MTRSLDRLDTRLSKELWAKLRRLARGWDVNHDEAVRRLIDSGGGETAYVAPGSSEASSSAARSHASLLKP